MFIRDALRFISAFIVPISSSAPQIYLSALPFAPEHSLVAEIFCPRFPNTLTISDGRPSQWPMIVFVAEHHRDDVWCIVLSPDEKTFASISEHATMYVCDSETGHCISGPFELGVGDTHYTGLDACFSPDGKHILVRYRDSDTLSCCAVVWNIEKGEEVFRIEGFNFVFIHCGCNDGRIVSMDWTDEDGSPIRTVASEDKCPTRILVKLWNIGNGISDRLFEVTGVTVAQFSPNEKYLAVERHSESVVELWNLEDGKITHRFPHPPGNLESLHFSPISDCLVAAFMSDHNCLWRLDMQEILSFDLNAGHCPAVIHTSHTNCIFCLYDEIIVEVWEVSATGSNMVFETDPLKIQPITSICPSRNGHRLLIGSEDGTVRMLNLEDLGSSQPVTQDDMHVPQIKAFSPSGNMVATISRDSTYVELRDTTTWELVGPRDLVGLRDHDYNYAVAFSADDNRIAVLSESLVTICDINHLENRLSFNPWPKRRSSWMRKAAFQTCNNLVLCAELKGDDSHERSRLLQVWKVKDRSECIFSLDKYQNIRMAPDGLTFFNIMPNSCYSWNPDTVQFDRIHFTDEVHLDWNSVAYSPDGKFLACRSEKGYNIRVWDTRTGQLCGKPITMPIKMYSTIALSPALNDRSLGDRLIALHYRNTNTIALFNIHTNHLYAQFWDPNKEMAFIRDGTRLMSYYYHGPNRIYNIADLTVKHRNATHGHQPVPRGMRDGWMVGQDDELLFWVPLEHRDVLCLDYAETTWGRPTKVDLYKFKFGSEWTECIDQEWLKGLEERGQRVGKLLG